MYSLFATFLQHYVSSERPALHLLMHGGKACNKVAPENMIEVGGCKNDLIRPKRFLHDISPLLGKLTDIKGEVRK